MCIHSKLKSSRWYQKCLHTFFEITTTDNFLGKNNVKKFWGRDAFKSLAVSVLLSLGEGRQSRDIRSGHSCRSLPPVLIMQMPSFKLIYLVLVIHHYWRSLAACLLILKLFRGWKVSGLFVNQLQFLVYHFQWIQCLLTPKLFRSSGLFVSQLQFVYHFKYKWSDHNHQIANSTSVRHNFSL